MSATLNTVPCGKLVTVMPSRALAPAPDISTVHVTRWPLASRVRASRFSSSGTKKICKWLGSASTRSTTAVNTYVTDRSYIANEWCADAVVAMPADVSTARPTATVVV
jgi:hypothetical protein